MRLKAIDLFAGCGGTSSGAAAAGLEVIWAANHDRRAVATHQSNHPRTLHVCQDLGVCDWTRVPDHDICLASPACIPDNSPVVRADGSVVPASTIRVGDELLTHMGRGRPVVNVWKRKFTGKVYHVRAYGDNKHDVAMTGDHLVWARRRYGKFRKLGEPRFIQAAELRVGDYVAYPRIPAVMGTAERFVHQSIPSDVAYLMPTRVIPPHVRRGVAAKGRTIDSHYGMTPGVKIILPGSAKELWWLIGHYLGDGDIRKDGRFQVTWSIGDVPENGQRTRECLKGVGLRSTARDLPANDRVQTSSSHLHAICSSFGGYAWTKRVPAELLAIETGPLTAIMDGYFDADGSERQASVLVERATCTSLGLLQDLQVQAWRLGWSASIAIADYARVAQIQGRVVNCRDSWEISVRRRPHKQSRTKFTDTHTWRSVSKIVVERVEDLEVVDFEVEKDHTFCLPGMVVHNCQGHSYAKGRTKDWSERSRATAWCVLNAVAARRPRFVVVENLPEFRTWTESALPGQEATAFLAWRHLVATVGVGYHYSEVVLDAADLGVPQHRERLFMVFARRDVAAAPVPLPPPPPRSHVPFAAIMEDVPFRSKVADKAPTTRGLVRRASPRHRGRPFLVQYNGEALRRGLGRPIDRPLGTLTTVARYALVDRSHRWIRMLTVGECRRAMGFPDTYRLPGRQRDALWLLGNAVVPAAASHVLGAVVAAARGRTRAASMDRVG